MEIIIGRQGTQKIPITNPTVSRKHCKVIDNGDGTYIIENLSPSGTKVDGVEIIRATAKPNSRIQLGQNFSSTLVELIGVPQAASKPQTQSTSAKPAAQGTSSTRTQPEVKTFNISHLRRVWEDYNNANIEMADSQRKINLIRSGLGIFTMCAMPTIYFLGPVGYALTGIGVLGNIYSFAGMRNAETAAEKQERKDAFDLKWICPNPDCKRSLPLKSYRVFIQTVKECPCCKCKFVEK